MTKLNVVVDVEVDEIAESVCNEDEAMGLIVAIDGKMADWLFTEKVAVHFLNLLKQSECCEDDVFKPEIDEILKNWKIKND